MVLGSARTNHYPFLPPGLVRLSKWGGVPMRRIMELVRPLPEARYAVFYSLADGWRRKCGRHLRDHRADLARLFATERILWLARIVFSTGTHEARSSKEKQDAYCLHRPAFRSGTGN